MQINYHYQWLTPVQANRPTLVCLHGFSGDLTTFAFFKEQTSVNVLALDLIGHGQTKSLVHPNHYRMENIVLALEQLFAKLGLTKFFLLGYSMGGRVALAYSLHYSARLAGLILENATAGLPNATARQARRIADQHLAARLWNRPLQAFVDEWQALALFASQKNLPLSQQQAVRQTRLSQNKYGLAMALRYFGTGSQPNYWSRLAQLTVPVLYVSGQLDTKFYAIGQTMCQSLSATTAHFCCCADAGHCVHLEKPVWFLQQVLAWIELQEKTDEDCGSNILSGSHPS